MAPKVKKSAPKAKPVAEKKPISKAKPAPKPAVARRLTRQAVRETDINQVVGHIGNEFQPIFEATLRLTGKILPDMDFTMPASYFSHPGEPRFAFWARVRYDLYERYGGETRLHVHDIRYTRGSSCRLRNIKSAKRRAAEEYYGYDVAADKIGLMVQGAEYDEEEWRSERHRKMKSEGWKEYSKIRRNLMLEAASKMPIEEALEKYEKYKANSKDKVETRGKSKKER